MKRLTGKDLELTSSSDYLTDEFYAALISNREAVREMVPCSDMKLASECGALLNYEARLLDQKRYKDWLDLYTRDAIYWLPYDDEADIRKHVNLVFDDRRRLEDRILRLTSGFAHSIVPERESQHCVSSVEAWKMEDGHRRVLASQVVYEYRPGHEVKQYVFRSDHTLREIAGQWKIAVKRCVLLNREAAIEPPTLL